MQFRFQSVSVGSMRARQPSLLIAAHHLRLDARHSQGAAFVAAVGWSGTVGHIFIVVIHVTGGIACIDDADWRLLRFYPFLLFWPYTAFDKVTFLF